MDGWMATFTSTQWNDRFLSKRKQKHIVVFLKPLSKSIISAWFEQNKQTSKQTYEFQLVACAGKWWMHLGTFRKNPRSESNRCFQPTQGTTHASISPDLHIWNCIITYCQDTNIKNICQYVWNQHLRPWTWPLHPCFTFSQLSISLPRDAARSQALMAASASALGGVFPPPIWKIWSLNWIIFPGRGEKKQVKPPTRSGLMLFCFHMFFHHISKCSNTKHAVSLSLQPSSPSMWHMFLTCTKYRVALH